ncbi:MAG: patatin-like phospholipase family protein [Lentimicrobiaceae bacterium]|nr:patatin-like phospholipase family protein [Lentimicrobiaceae bacterium]
MKPILRILLFITSLCSLFAGLSAQEAETQTQLKSQRPRIGLVLSGGGAKGIAHVGVLKVLEELNIPIDYIAGTSMGSIIGGLYAYGYSAHELDSILRATDWGILLNDAPDWRDVFYMNKTPYLLNFPWGLKEEKTSFAPAGLLKGQHVNNLFYTLTSRAYHYKSFEDFNIPFFCVAADITSGQPAYLDHGNLALSMRASMAIPSVFTPVKLDSMILVDGGVLNNFPVDKISEKDVDIIIGVDVGFSYASAEHVNSFMDVLEEVIFMGSKSRIMENRARCDVFIKPNMTGYSTASFNKTDSILARGEQAARDSAVYAQLKQLADRLAQYGPDPEKEKKPYHPVQEIYISRIEYKGLKKYNQTYINQFLQIETDKTVKLEAINKGIDRLYGINRFKTVSYEFKVDEQDENGTVLVISVEEAPSNAFKLGIRYDNIRMAGLLAGVELQNFGVKNSTLSLDVELSKMPAVSANFRFMPQWKHKSNKYSFWIPSLGAGFDYFNFKSYLYRDPENQKRRTSDMTSNRYKIKLYGQSSWRTNVLGVGFAYEFSDNQIRISNTDSINRHDIYSNHHVYPYFYYRHDNFDKKFYPSRGFKMTLDVTFPIDLGNHNHGKGLTSADYFLNVYWKGDFAIPAGKRLTFYPGFTVGLTPIKNHRLIPIQHQFFQGGCADLNSMYVTMMPGVMLGQSSGYHLVNLRLTAQVMVVKNLYVSVRGGVGKADYELKDLVLKYKNLIYGGNIGISYETPIGPVGLSFQSSNVHNFNVFLHIGYWF